MFPLLPTAEGWLDLWGRAFERDSSGIPGPFLTEGDFAMALYMYQAAYTPESLAAQIKEPHDRIEAVGRRPRPWGQVPGGRLSVRRL